MLAERDSALLGDTLNFPVLPDWNYATALGITELPECFRGPLLSGVPTLFLSGTLDGRTYPSSHREMAEGFSRATFVAVEGAGHDLFMSSPDVEERILDFLAHDRTSAQPIDVSHGVTSEPTGSVASHQ